jgi:two-component system, NarL family, invasion response regulator UvrY
MLKILIADDYVIVRRGLKQILLEEYPAATIEEAENYPDLLEKVSRADWDIIVSDFVMPGGGGFQAIKEIKEKARNLPILIVSISSEEQYAFRLLKAGASGYLSKDVVPEELIKAVKQIVSGKRYISEAMAERLVDKLQNDSDFQLHEFLSERELEVFRLIAKGKSISEIGELLDIGQTTASTYRSRILKKMNLNTNAELTRYSIEYNLQ